MLEGIPIGFIAAAMGLYGLNGLVPIFWYVDHRRMQRKDEEDRKEYAQLRETHDKELRMVLEQYKDDVRKVAGFYESNVELVKKYEKLSAELMETIRLNIQVMTQLSDNIRNNLYCPLVREKGPHG